MKGSDSIFKLIDWFYKNRRHFPWRESPTPYHVWISEIMLQQTRASVVVSYFLKWMEKFPDIQTLAEANQTIVLKTWEGLGYYSRARNIHETAKILMAHYGGEFPKCKKEIQDLKGIGPYTVGAILSFAFKQKAAAIDGNVLRVLTRYFALEEEISTQKAKKKVEEKLLSLLPDQEPWVAMEAFIELGALVCTPRPKCKECPIQMLCKAKKRNHQHLYPVKKKRAPLTKITREVFVIVHKQSILLKRGGKGKIMQDLWEFPYIDQKQKPWKIKGNYIKTLPEVTHTFTRYKAVLYPKLYYVSNAITIEGYRWIPWEHITQLPFSSGHKRVLRHLWKEKEKLFEETKRSQAPS